MSLHRTFVLKGPAEWKMLSAFLKMNAAACAQNGKPLAVTVTEHKAKRSTLANARYWAMLAEIAEQSFVGGKKFSNEVWHEHLGRMLIGCEDLPGGGMKAISTTTLDVEAFSRYMDQVESYAATELGVRFTDPHH